METATRGNDRRGQAQTQRKRCTDINGRGRVRDEQTETDTNIHLKQTLKNRKKAVCGECRMETHSQKNISHEKQRK